MAQKACHIQEGSLDWFGISKGIEKGRKGMRNKNTEGHFEGFEARPDGKKGQYFGGNQGREVMLSTRGAGGSY